MKSARALQRDMKNIAERMIRDEAQGKWPNVDDLAALKETVDLLLDILRPGEGEDERR